MTNKKEQIIHFDKGISEIGQKKMVQVKVYYLLKYMNDNNIHFILDNWSYYENLQSTVYLKTKIKVTNIKNAIRKIIDVLEYTDQLYDINKNTSIKEIKEMLSMSEDDFEAWSNETGFALGETYIEKIEQE